jgi:hypothetical protein
MSRLSSQSRLPSSATRFRFGRSNGKVIGFSQSAAREAKKWISQQDPFISQISTLDAEFPILALNCTAHTGKCKQHLYSESDVL